MFFHITKPAYINFPQLSKLGSPCLRKLQDWSSRNDAAQELIAQDYVQACTLPAPNSHKLRSKILSPYDPLLPSTWAIGNVKQSILKVFSSAKCSISWKLAKEKTHCIGSKRSANLDNTLLYTEEEWFMNEIIERWSQSLKSLDCIIQGTEKTRKYFTNEGWKTIMGSLSKWIYLQQKTEMCSATQYVRSPPISTEKEGKTAHTIRQKVVVSSALLCWWGNIVLEDYLSYNLIP